MQIALKKDSIGFINPCGCRLLISFDMGIGFLFLFSKISISQQLSLINQTFTILKSYSRLLKGWLVDVHDHDTHDCREPLQI